MGAINYGTSDYITLGYNCNTKYVFDDFWEDEEEQRNFEIGFLYDEIKEELEKYYFYYFHVAIKPGYYEGFYIDIENNYSCFFQDAQDKREAQKEVTKLKAFLMECVDFGLVQVWPSWCTSYETHDGTIAAIKTAIKKIRAEIRDTPTWYTYNHSA